MQLIEGQNLAALVGELRPGAAGGAVPRPGDEATGPYPPPPRPTSAPIADTRTALGAQLSTQRSARPADFVRTVVRLAAQAAEGLEYAHGVGVVHRDIKPANLLVDGRGNVWITDFGLAQFHADAALTQSGDLLGTLRYMSPEQAGGPRGVLDHRTDVYALGATLYELLTLRPIFDGGDRQTLLHQILHEEPRPPRALERAIPPELETVVLKAVAKAPAERYATAQEMADDLQRFLEDRPIRARRPSPVEKAWKWARRHKAVVASALAALLLSVAVLAAGTALTASAYGRERQKAREADEQRSRAEESFRQARRAVDQFAQISEEELAGNPALEGVRRRLLEAALEYYQDFINQRHDDPSIQEELEASRAKVETILAELTTLMGEGRYAVLHRKPVQDELGLAEDQRDALARIDRRRREGYREFPRLALGERERRRVALARDQEADVAKLLTPEQFRRFQQIALQDLGPAAFRDPDLVAALKLTAEQRERIRAIEIDTLFGKPDGFRPGQPPTWEARAEAMRSAMEKAQALLTEEQARQWKKMTGEPSKAAFTSRPPVPFAPGGPR
jgi:hypothetical protein